MPTYKRILMAQQSSGRVAYVTPMVPDSRAAKANQKLQADITDPVDLTPSDSQPPGVDEDIDLEEALTSL